MTVARAVPERGRRQRASTKDVAPPDPRRQRLLRDIAMILIAPLLLYLLVCLATYSPDAPGWSTAAGGVTAPLSNAGGPVGAWIADVLLYLTGYVAYLLPLVLGAVAWIALFGSEPAGGGGWISARRCAWWASSASWSRPPGCCTCAWARCPAAGWRRRGAGAAGGKLLDRGFGALGGNMFLLALLLVSVTLATGLSGWRWPTGSAAGC